MLGGPGAIFVAAAGHVASNILLILIVQLQCTIWRGVQPVLTICCCILALYQSVSGNASEYNNNLPLNGMEQRRMNRLPPIHSSLSYELQSFQRKSMI